MKKQYKQVEKFINKLQSEHNVKVLSVNKENLITYITDTSYGNAYLYCFDFSNYPKTINISTMKEFKNGGHYCLVYYKCNLDKFNWHVEKSRAYFYEVFGIEM